MSDTLENDINQVQSPLKSKKNVANANDWPQQVSWNTKVPSMSIYPDFIVIIIFIFFIILFFFAFLGLVHPFTFIDFGKLEYIDIA